MSQDPPGSLGSASNNAWSGERREPGTRRRKLAGYLKAANELRQSYQQQYTSQWSQRSLDAEDDQGIPGAFPDVAVVRSGDEEMVLFPSYARRHVKKKSNGSRRPSEGLENASNAGDWEYSQGDRNSSEEDTAIVDVDVRGWIYSPHRGPMNRRNRLLIGLARRLSGIPAPSASPGNSRDSSQHSAHQERLEDRSARREEELVSREAQSIMRKGEGEADIAWRGGYSEKPGQDSDRNSVYSSRSASPDPYGEPEPGRLRHPVTESSMASDQDDASIKSISKRSSWNQPADMTPAELSAANTHLMSRLKPFLTTPVVGVGITAFFWNDDDSQSRSSYTNESGHFVLRASLDFVPTNVRVLASEKLSVTEEIRITDPTGVSLISDIDDTIKHSGIGTGARDIFRNTFIRELSDLTIVGVKEWYNKLAEMGVKMHYVSNSPWQLFPLLKSYFALSGLPPGSFHLKQYNGMLQGIFEPVAERKKGTLEKIMRDFPERRFILVGDSGEADLEVYTDIVTANPGRVLGVFIRDVTTPEKKNFFDHSTYPAMDPSLNVSRESLRSGSRYDISNRRPVEDEIRPPLPTRRPLERVKTEPVATGPAMGTLIDFGDGGDEKSTQQSSENLNGIQFDVDISGNERPKPQTRSTPPARPSKPAGLRSPSNEARAPPMERGLTVDGTSKKATPPLPPKPRRLSNRQVPAPSNTPSPLSQEQRVDSPTSTPDPQNNQSTVRDKVTSAYNKLPSPSSYLYGAQPARGSERSVNSTRSSSISSESEKPPPPPPRKGITSYPASAAQYASSTLSNTWMGSNNSGTGDGGYSGGTAPINKKVEIWKRRWERAKHIMEHEGVTLRTWRVGGDVMKDSVRLVEKAMKDLERRKR